MATVITFFLANGAFLLFIHDLRLFFSLIIFIHTIEMTITLRTIDATSGVGFDYVYIRVFNIS